MYSLVKHIHMAAVTISLLLFLLRCYWVWMTPENLQKRWVRIVPHIVDTALLASALTLAWLLSQYPFIDHWLTAKVLALLLYIILGSLALKRAKTNASKALAMLGALATFAYIVSVALTHNPMPWQL